ncbi:Os02g0493087, partial [Oryza sativa Japonica Group]
MRRLRLVRRTRAPSWHVMMASFSRAGLLSSRKARSRSSMTTQESTISRRWGKAAPRGTARVSGRRQTPTWRRVREEQAKSAAGRRRSSGHGRLTNTRSWTPLAARASSQRATSPRCASMEVVVRCAQRKGPGCAARTRDTAATTPPPPRPCGARWASTSARGTECQTPRQRVDSAAVRAPSLAGRRDTTSRRSSSGRRLMRSTPSAGARAAAAGARRGRVETGGSGMESPTRTRISSMPTSSISGGRPPRCMEDRMWSMLTPTRASLPSSMVAGGGGGAREGGREEDARVWGVEW